MQKSNNKNKIKLKTSFVSQRIGDKITIFDAERSTLYTFNGSATFIFDRLKKGLNTAKIIRELVRNFNVNEKKAEKDFEEFVKILISKDLATKNSSS